ncbi:MAG: F0F1 ATP synthase subunit gamma [Alphaproteobacteria bacterium]
MPSLKALRGRIKSVKNTRQITKTMKMVAAAKVRRARSNVEAARPYAQRLGGVLSNLAATCTTGGPLLLAGRAEVKTVRLMVMGSDRGLCGGFNANVLKQLFAEVKRLQAAGKTVQIFAVGRKVRDGVRIAYPQLLMGAKMDISRSINFALAEELAQQATDAFVAGECDMVKLVFSRCVSMLTQTPVAQQLIPFEATATASAKASFAYEPDEAAILADLLPRNIKTQVFCALLESMASEQAARMTAMDNATRNAGEMIQKLTLTYNRNRQAAITKELIEIISGAQAV